MEHSKVGGQLHQLRSEVFDAIRAAPHISAGAQCGLDSKFTRRGRERESEKRLRRIVDLLASNGLNGLRDNRKSESSDPF